MDPSELAAYAVDGVVPRAVLFPRSEEEISEVMKAASRESVCVTPAGSLTKRGLGNVPERLDVVLSTLKLDRVLEQQRAFLRREAAVDQGGHRQQTKLLLGGHGWIVASAPKRSLANPARSSERVPHHRVSSWREVERGAHGHGADH